MDSSIIRKNNYFIIIFIILISLNCMSFELQDNSKCIYGNCRNGFGIKRDSNHNSAYIYIGEWKNGNRYGNGTLHHKRYSSKSHGIWRNNKFIDGVISTKEGIYNIKNKNNEIIGEYISKISKIRYKGKFKYYNDKDQKKYYNPFNLEPFSGKIIWENGDSYKGNFGCVKRDLGGVGLFHRYDYLCSYPSGHGVYSCSDGKTFKGFFSIKIIDGVWVGIIENNSTQTNFHLQFNSKEPVISYSIKIINM